MFSSEYCEIFKNTFFEKYLRTATSKHGINQGIIYLRRLYLAGGMTNLYPFIWKSLKWSFRELFFSDVTLWNQYKYKALNIFLCRILIISCKILIIIGLFNEETNELTIYAKLCRSVTIFYRQVLASFFKCRKNWGRAGIQNKVFRVTVSLLMSVI